MKINNYGADHPHAVIRGRVAGSAAVGTATLTTLALVVITPTALGANTDDWNPTGLSTADIIRASASAAYNLTGIVAPSDDRIIILDNIGTFAITLKHNVTSTAANRFLCPNDADLTLQPDTNVWLQYDLTSTRWRVVGGTGSGSAIGTPGNAYSLGTLGATPTVTFTNGTWQYGTLNGAGSVTPTISFAGFTSGKDDGLTLELTQDGTGGITPVLSGVTWLDGTPTWVTTAGTTTLVGILSRDGGSTILAGIIGGGLASSSFATPAIVLGTAAAAGSAATTIRSDATIVAFDATVPTTQAFGDAAATGSSAHAARRDHLHGMPAAPAGSDTSAWQHAHIENVVYSGDGATTVFTLPVACVDATSVDVYVAGSRSIAWVLSGTMFDTLTFDSAPASATNNVVVDIVTPIV